MAEETLNNSNTANRMGSGKKLIFALAAMAVIPVLLLLLTEAALRMAGYGYPTTYFLERTINGEKFLTENDQFAWRFFPKELARSPSATKFKAEKAPGTQRIFIFGESAALGDPKPAYSMGRYLKVLLQDQYPGQKFEVLTVAMTAINSHAILPIARECARLEGDFWIIYMGNNEMMGPFGANPISGPAAPGLSRIRLLVALRGTRLGQAMEQLAIKMTKKSEGQTWEGMKTFLSHLVIPGAPEKDKVRANFQKNLQEIIQLGQRAGVKPIVCTVAGNLKDCAPFASIHTPAISSARRQEIEAMLKGTNNVETLINAAAEDAAYAELHYLVGAAELARGKVQEASAAFNRARDYDALPFRTDSQMNALIRSGAKGTVLADVEQALAAQSPDQLPGGETFFDHVHFTFEGNYRVAKILAETLAPALKTSGQGNPWPAFETCNEKLALTDWNRRAACEHMLQRLAEPPFSTQSNHREREDSLARQIIAYRSSATPQARPVYEQAIAANPDDFRLLENYSEFLELSGDTKGAIEQWHRIAKLLPYQHAPFYQWGRLLARENRNAEARIALTQALVLRPDLAEAMTELGQINFREEKWSEALAEYARAVKLRPQDSRLRIYQADALAASGNRGAAMEKLREAVALRPNHWEARYLLGIELASTNRIPEAIAEFAQVTQMRPDYAQAHFNLGVALAKEKKINEAYAEFRRTLELEPTHRLAGEYVRMIESAAKK